LTQYVKSGYNEGVEKVGPAVLITPRPLALNCKESRAMPTLTAPRRPYQATRPVSGGCRWACQPGVGKAAHPGVLVVTSTDAQGNLNVGTFTVSEHRDAGRLVGYRLTKPDGQVYDLPADLSACDCPDGTYHSERPGGCRHRKALRAALAALEG
jgi:hypothetical protein